MPTISVMVVNPMSGTPSMVLAMPAPVVKITLNPAFSASLAWKALVTPGAIKTPGCSRSWRRRRRGFSDMGVPCRDRSGAGGPAGNGPRDVPAVAAGDQHLALVHHHPTAHHGRYRPATKAPAIVDGVIGVGAEAAGVDHLLAVEVDQGQIGIRPHRDAALLGVQTEDAGRVGAHQLRHPLQGNAPLVMALAQQHGKQGGHTGEAGAGA